ncbi:MAG: glycosyltransferase family 2 protein [Elusimicrobiota bacterium]
MKTTLLMFTLNEIDGLKAILPKINKTWVDETLIIDGGSTDGSIEYARGLGFNVINQKSKGIVNGIKEGIEASAGDVLITFTPDGNMIPEKIPELVEKMKESYDMVIVSRYAPGAKSYDDSLVSGFGNWMFTALVNVLFNARYTDVLGFYRAYKKNLIKDLGIEIKLSIDTQLCIRCAKMEMKVTEIPGDEPERISGKSYRSIIKNGLIELFTILEEFLKK